nr:UPF0481 protein At3g47200-like [Ipomoea batatas]
MNRRSSSTYTDVLHGLHCRCVGIVEESHHQNGNVDLEVGINSRNYLDPKEGEGQRIPSATTMYSEGIDFKAVSGMAIREIQIKDGCLFMGKVLHLPVFTFNNMTKEMYTSLKAYENDHRLREREVSDYLRFLCDIVRTDQDAALLEQKGVIEVDGSNKILIDEVAGYLKSMACAGAGADAGASGDSLLLPLTSTNLRKKPRRFALARKECVGLKAIAKPCAGTRAFVVVNAPSLNNAVVLNPMVAVAVAAAAEVVSFLLQKWVQQWLQKRRRHALARKDGVGLTSNASSCASSKAFVAVNAPS